MRRYLYIILCLVSLSSPLFGQRTTSRRDALRYNQMNEQGVWSVGITVTPVESITHKVSASHGGGSFHQNSILGMGIEGGYFVADNLRLSAGISFVNNSWQTAFMGGIYDAYSSLAHTNYRLGAHWHIARWDFGGGLNLTHTTLRYVAADVAEGGTNDPRFGGESFKEHSTSFGLTYEAGYMISPFLKVSALYEPSLFFGGGFTHTLSARITLYLPFVNSVVCK